MAGRRSRGKRRIVVLPTVFRPQLASLVKAAPPGDDWFHEIKLDGYRIGARVADGHVTLLSRNGPDWPARFPKVAAAAASLSVQTAFLDEEVAVLLADGRTPRQPRAGVLPVR